MRAGPGMLSLGSVPLQLRGWAMRCCCVPMGTFPAFPSLQLQQGFPGPKLLESTEGQGGDESPATLQKGTDVGATYMCFYNPRLFCNVCSHIRINKQAVTLPVDALNALLHSKHGNELVTWKVLSLTWAVHVQRGKKKPVSQIQ